jgi:transposase InsO family protein
MYLDSKPVLHVIDEATAFQAARFLRDLSTKTTWETLRICWINVYQGPPNIIISDAGKNFASEEFRQHASSLNIDIKEIPVEAYNSIRKVERYHSPLRRVYEILTKELPTTMNKEALL